MKNRIAALAALFVMTSSVFATNSPPPPPPPAKPATATSKSTSSATAGAVAGSNSEAGASVDGVSSNAEAGDASSRSGSSIVDNGSSRAWSLFLPPSVFTPPMPRPEIPMGCPAPTETQSALEVGKGVLFSKADSFRDNNPCTAIKYSQLLWDRCQYRKADRALNIGLKLFAKTAGEDWDAAPNPDLIDYKASECVVLRNPPPVTNHYVTNYVAEAPKPTPPAPAVTPCPKGQKRNSKGVCYTPTPPCEEGKILACTKK